MTRRKKVYEEKGFNPPPAIEGEPPTKVPPPPSKVVRGTSDFIIMVPSDGLLTPYRLTTGAVFYTTNFRLAKIQATVCTMEGFTSAHVAALTDGIPMLVWHTGDYAWDDEDWAALGMVQEEE